MESEPIRTFTYIPGSFSEIVSSQKKTIGQVP
jgi:hypothetical protein